MAGYFRCECGNEWHDVQPTYRGNFQDFPKCFICGKQMTEKNYINRVDRNDSI